MMRAHCDRCEILIGDGAISNGVPGWVEETPQPPPVPTCIHQYFDLGRCITCFKSQGQIDDERRGVTHIWHVHIWPGGDLRKLDQFTYCRACQIVILELYVQSLKDKEEKP